MGGVAFDFTAVVEQVVVCGHLALIVHRRRPVIEIGRAADEITRGNDGVRVKHRQEQFSIEPVHASAEAGEAVDDVLPVEQPIDPSLALSVHDPPRRSGARSARPARRATREQPCRRHR